MKESITITESRAIGLSARAERLQQQMDRCEPGSEKYSLLCDKWIETNLQLDDIYKNWSK